MTIEDYLQGRVLPNYPFTDNAIQVALLPRVYIGVNGTTVTKGGIEAGTDTINITQKEMDLAEAVLWIASASLVDGGGSSKSMGSSSMKEGSVSSSDEDKNFRIAQAKAIWKTYKILDGTPYIGVATIRNGNKYLK